MQLLLQRSPLSRVSARRGSMECQLQNSLHGCPLAAATAVQRNQNFGKLQAGYLFPEVGSLCAEQDWPEQAMTPAKPADCSEAAHSPGEAP